MLSEILLILNDSNAIITIINNTFTLYQFVLQKYFFQLIDIPSNEVKLHVILWGNAPF